MRSAANDSVTYSDATVSGLFRRTYEVQSRHVDPAWNLARVTRRGFGVLNSFWSVVFSEPCRTCREKCEWGSG